MLLSVVARSFVFVPERFASRNHIGNVVQDLGGADNVSITILERRNRNRDIYRVTVFRDADGLQVLEWQPAAEPCENLFFFVQPVRGNYSRDRLANHLRGAITQYSFGAGVPALDNPVEILCDDAVAGKFHYRRQSRASQFSAALFGDIAKDHDDAERRAIEIADRGGAVIDGNLLPVAGNEDRMVGQADSLADTQDFIDRIFCSVAVISLTI
jgi:hypothetical protein